MDDMVRGKLYLSSLNVDFISELRNGCQITGSTDIIDLKQILRALDFKVQLNEYDNVAIGLHKCLVVIIGNYVPQIAPKVNAGVDKIIQFPASTTFTAVITPGSASIVSILWTQVLGGNTATLTNSNTATITVSNTIVSDYMFRVEVTDSNGLKGFDTVILSVVALIGSSDVRTSALYNTVTNRVTINSVIIPELIGCDLTYFEAHRGVGTGLKGLLSSPTENSVQVNTTTGQVTFFQDFTSFQEDLWFDYKMNINI
ncbi:PKD domain-containing protein [uncultured Clostridium sp.]|uniref:PKD domain-containing protein n=1 Tax=uncultured Clostridium sp. TaxID=59620 RepID=UPI00261D8ACB|nr:hypothetical protein [uncultured Clostridium sp.]